METNVQTTVEDHIAQARKHFEAAEYQEALRSLQWGFLIDSSVAELYRLAADALAGLGSEEEKLFRQAVDRFDEFQPFYDLGYHFVDTRNLDLARPFLERAMEIDPTSLEAAFELSVAYSGRFQVVKAIETILSVDYSADFWLTYRLHECNLLNNETRGIETFIRDARRFLDNKGDDQSQFALFKIDSLEEALNRYHFVGRPNLHVRDWHFIQFGGAVLDYFDDSGEYSTGGRFVYTWGSMKGVRQDLEFLKLFLNATGRAPGRVISLTDRNSEIVGRAASEILSLDFGLYEPGNDMSDSLIVAGDNSEFNGMEELARIQPNQTVFALNLNWFSGAMIAPDIAGFMSQGYWFPWEAGLRVTDDDAQETEPTEPDMRDPVVIAAELASTQVETKEAFEKHLDFYRHAKDHLKGGPKGGDTRAPFGPDSPAPVSYFL